MVYVCPKFAVDVTVSNIDNLKSRVVSVGWRQVRWNKEKSEMVVSRKNIIVLVETKSSYRD